MRYELKRLTPEGLPAAIEKADRYRDLNQPDEAESICRDVLDVDPTNQAALRILGLALTDKFPRELHALFDQAIAVFEKLESEYERVYYTGIAWERSAKAQLERGEAQNAHHSFEQALALFDRAEKLAGKGAADPVLRWNRCVRALRATEFEEVRKNPRATTFTYDD